MTEKQILKWIKDNLGPVIRKAIADTGCIYTEDWLAGMACREVNFLIARYAGHGMIIGNINPLMKGDYGQRPGEKEKSYHGFSYWQIDIGSYPDFVKSGAWKDPYKACMKAIQVLGEKHAYLVASKLLTTDNWQDAITAAYNCGQGNVAKALKAGKDVDIYTHQKNYSKEVRRYRGIYLTL